MDSLVVIVYEEVVMVKTRRPECNSCKTILYAFDFSLRSVGQSAPFRGKHDFAYIFSFHAETVNIFTYSQVLYK